MEEAFKRKVFWPRNTRLETWLLLILAVATLRYAIVPLLMTPPAPRVGAAVVNWSTPPALVSTPPLLEIVLASSRPPAPILTLPWLLSVPPIKSALLLTRILPVLTIATLLSVNEAPASGVSVPAFWKSSLLLPAVPVELVNRYKPLPEKTPVA